MLWYNRGWGFVCTPSPDRSAPGSSRESAHGRGPSIEKPCSGRAEYSSLTRFLSSTALHGGFPSGGISSHWQRAWPFTPTRSCGNYGCGSRGGMGETMGVAVPGAETASLIQLTACWDSAGVLAGPFLRRVSPLHPEGLRGGYSTYHAPLGGLSVGKTLFYTFPPVEARVLKLSSGSGCSPMTSSPLISPRLCGYLVPLAFRRSSMFPEGNVPGYVCNPGSPRERDAASQGHTSGIPTRAMLHSWKLAPAAHHVLLSILVMTSPHLMSGRQFWLITHMIQSWTTLMAFP